MQQKNTKKEIRAHFDKRASVYRQGNPPWMPEYHHALGLVAETLASYLPPKAHVVDLGAGTGNLSKKVLHSFPGSRVTLVDFSGEMLNKTSEVLAGCQGRYEIRNDDFFTAGFPEKSCDAVISSFAIHHGRKDSDYLRLYRNIFRWLKRTGVFVCCDIVKGDTPAMEKLNIEGWRGFMQGNMSPRHVNMVLKSYRTEDSPITIRKHLSFLVRAGFQSADIVWKKYNFCVYAGIKQGRSR